MNSKSQKMWSALAASLVAVTSSLSAVDDMQMRNLENRVSALEQRRGANGMINPPARPVVKDGCDFWIQGEGLFMQPTEDGLSLAIPTDASVSYVDGRIHNAKYDWSWGFRVGAGYNMPHDGWDLMFGWTWFRAQDHNHKDRVVNENMLGTQMVPATANADVSNLDRASAHLHLQINMADLEMGREFFVSKWLTLRPHLGFRGAWVRRTFDPKYTGGSIAPAGASDDVYRKNSISGFGILGGLDSQWGLGSGWSFYGNFALSMIYGRQHTSLKEYTSTANSNPGTERWDGRNHWTAVRPITDLAIGLRWDHLFADDQYRVRFQVGWEQLLFFGFGQDMNFYDSTAIAANGNQAGDLGLSGISFQARFDF